MSDPIRRLDWRILNWLLGKLGDRYFLGVLPLALSLAFPAASIGVYYALMMVELSPDQVRTLLWTVIILVVVANGIGSYYGYRLNQHVQAVFRVPPDQVSPEMEQMAWQTVTVFPWRVSLFSYFNTLFVVIFPTIALMIAWFGLHLSQSLYLLISGLLAEVWFALWYYLAWDWLLWPVRRSLLKRFPRLQHIPPAGLSIGRRMLLFQVNLIFTLLVITSTLVYQKTQQALAPGADPARVLQNLPNHILFASLIGLVLTAVFTLLLVRSVTNPLRHLLGVIEVIEQGNLTQRAEVLSTDETARLTMAFNRMVSQIERFQSGLEQQVAQRTSDLARRTAQLEAAAHVARRAAEIRDLDTLLNETVRLISDRFGFYHAGIFLVDEAGEYAVLRAASSEGGQRMLARGHKLAVGKVGIVGYVAGTGKPRIALDVGADAVFFDNPDLPLTRSEMALPLKVGEQIIGVLDVQSEEPAAFTEEELSVLQVLADQIALAIESARLLNEAQRTVQELSRLYSERTREIWRTRDRAHRLLGYRYRHPVIEPVREVPEEAYQTAREGRPSVRQIREEGNGHVVGTIVTVPVKLRGQVVAALNVRFGSEEVTPEMVRLLEGIAERLALALENARLLEETRRRAEHERLTGEISQKLTTSIRMDRILQIAAEELNQALGGAEVLVQILPEIGRSATPKTK